MEKIEAILVALGFGVIMFVVMKLAYDIAMEVVKLTF
jgi:hypothetical protein